MREICVDLSEDKYSPVVFGGYLGEHNETKIVVKLPERMLTNDITKYQFVFKDCYNQVHLCDTVDTSDIGNGNVSTLLTRHQTVGTALMVGVNAIVEKDGAIERKGKTPAIFMKVRESV